MFETFLNNIPAFLFTVRLRDILDIAIVAYLFYMLSKFVRETRAGTLIKGIILLLIFTWVSNLLQLNTINYLLRNLMQFAFIALLQLLFQAEE